MPQPSTPSSPKSAPATVIAKGVRLEGDFKSQGDVLIEGEVHGTIQTDSLLTVGPEASVKAGITASDAVIAGKIDGNTNIKNRLEVKSTAQILGDIVCQTAVIEAGAKLQGNIKCGGNSDKSNNNNNKPEIAKVNELVKDKVESPVKPNAI
ncbi:polymer-forming cytoskeletal protein [Patescibacteria group bacterium]|nr:polymer-forming cytoskeletal protein [Patescibacteria group bacterium]